MSNKLGDRDCDAETVFAEEGDATRQAELLNCSEPNYLPWKTKVEVFRLHRVCATCRLVCGSIE